MNQFEILVDEADTQGIKIIEKTLKSRAKGLCKGNKIAIRKDVSTTKERTCILAEELGHYHTTVGNILNIEDVRNRKQELKARIWAYNKQIGLMGIVECFEKRCHAIPEMAEHLDVTEEFLWEALKYYKSKYGESVKLDNYILYFEPHIAVMKLL